jgi:hypothetical protein
MEIQKLKISEEERKLVSDFIGEDIGSEIDFNRLMPVVENIEGLSIDFEIHRETCKVWYKGERLFQRQLGETKIKAVWLAVIGFIEWYNKEQSVKDSDTSKAT